MSLRIKHILKRRIKQPWIRLQLYSRKLPGVTGYQYYHDVFSTKSKKYFYLGYKEHVTVIKKQAKLLLYSHAIDI